MTEAKITFDDGSIKFKYNIGDIIIISNGEQATIIAMNYHSKNGNTYDFDAGGGLTGNIHEDSIKVPEENDAGK